MVQAKIIDRGMSAWYEVAKPEEVFDFFKVKGFELEKMKTCAGGLGCNEFVFVKR